MNLWATTRKGREQRPGDTGTTGTVSPCGRSGLVAVGVANEVSIARRCIAGVLPGLM